MQRGGQAWRLQFEAIVQGKLQRQAQEILLDVAADLRDEFERVVITAEQDVLSIVEPGIVVPHAARAPAQLPGTFKHRHLDAVCGQGDGGGHAGVTATDNGYIQFFSHVLKESHNLRSGVSETRSFRTWQPEADTSFSVAR